MHARDTHCWLCGYPVDPSRRGTGHPLAGTVDEVTPLVYGGSATDPANCRLSHSCCNSSRQHREPTQAVRDRCRELYLEHSRPIIRPW